MLLFGTPVLAPQVGPDFALHSTAPPQFKKPNPETLRFADMM